MHPGAPVAGRMGDGAVGSVPRLVTSGMGGVGHSSSLEQMQEMTMRRSLIACALVLGCGTPTEPIAAEPGYDGAFDEVDYTVEALEEIAPEPEEAPEVPAGGLDGISVADMMRRVRRRTSRPEPTRDQIWDLLHLPQEDAEATALLRMCASEIEWANERDCLGIFQVATNVRARHCDNTRFGSSVTKRISQCSAGNGVFDVGPRETREGAEETMLSAFRRLSDRAIGAVPARTRRGEWISNVDLSCDEPESWPQRRSWEPRMRRRCEDASALVRGLVSGSRTRLLVREAVPIAWGGRCEDHCEDPSNPETCRATGACDDRMACRRRLARIPDTGTGNAFWCRVGSRGCATEIDPVCEQFASL